LIDLSQERPEDPISNPTSQDISNTNSIQDESAATSVLPQEPVQSDTLPISSSIQETNEIGQDKSPEQEENAQSVHHEEESPLVIVPSPVSTSTVPTVTVIMSEPVPISIVSPAKPAVEQIPITEETSPSSVQIPQEPIVVPTEPEISEENTPEQEHIETPASVSSSEEQVATTTTSLPHVPPQDHIVQSVAVPAVENESIDATTVSPVSALDGDSEKNESLSPTAQHIAHEPVAQTLEEVATHYEEENPDVTTTKIVVPEVNEVYVTTDAPQTPQDLSIEMVELEAKPASVKEPEKEEIIPVTTMTPVVSTEDEEKVKENAVQEISNVVAQVDFTTVKSVSSEDAYFTTEADVVEHDQPSYEEFVVPEVVKVEEIATTQVVHISSDADIVPTEKTVIPEIETEATTVGVDEILLQDDDAENISVTDKIIDQELTTIAPISEVKNEYDVTIVSSADQFVKEDDSVETDKNSVQPGITAVSDQHGDVVVIHHDSNEEHKCIENCHSDSTQVPVDSVTTVSPSNAADQEEVEEQPLQNDEPDISNLDSTTAFPYQLNENADEMYTKVDDESQDFDEAVTETYNHDEATDGVIETTKIVHDVVPVEVEISTDEPFVLFDGVNEFQAHVNKDAEIPVETVSTQQPTYTNTLGDDEMPQNDDSLSTDIVEPVQDAPAKTHQVNVMGDGTVEIIPHYPDQVVEDIAIENQVKQEQDEQSLPVAQESESLEEQTHAKLDEENAVEGANTFDHTVEATTVPSSSDIVDEEVLHDDNVSTLTIDMGGKPVYEDNVKTIVDVTTVQPKISDDAAGTDAPEEIFHDDQVDETANTETPNVEHTSVLNDEESTIYEQKSEVTTEPNSILDGDASLDSKFRLDLPGIVQYDEEATELPLSDQESIPQLVATTPSQGKVEAERSELVYEQIEMTTEPVVYQSDEQVQFDENVEATTVDNLGSKLRSDAFHYETTEVILQDATEAAINVARSEQIVSKEHNDQITTTIPIEKKLNDIVEENVPATTENLKVIPLNVAPETSSVDLDDTVVIEVEQRHDLNSNEDFVEVSTQVNSLFAAEFRDEEYPVTTDAPQSRSDLEVTTVDTIFVDRGDTEEKVYDEILTTLKPTGRLEQILLNKEESTTISLDLKSRSDEPGTTESQNAVEKMQYDDATEHEIDATTNSIYAATDNESVGDTIPSSDQIRKSSFNEMVIPEKGFPVIEPIVPEISKLENDLARFDLSESDSWLSRTFNRIKRLAEFLPILNRQSRDTKEKATSFKAKLKENQIAEKKERVKPNARRVKVPTKRFLLF